MLIEFPLPAMTIVAYKMPTAADLMASLDVRVKYVAFEMIPCVAVPNIPMHVIVVELSLDFAVVLSCLVLVPLSGIPLHGRKMFQK